MRSLPHITIACGAVWAGCRLLRALPRQSLPSSPDPEQNGASREAPSLADAIDYRLVAVGSLLPDMVDRSLRAAAGGASWSRDQHLLGHTLLLNSPLILAGIGLAMRHKDVKLLAIGTAAMTHLLVDPVIRSPRTLLWPLLGVAFQLEGSMASHVTNAGSGGNRDSGHSPDYSEKGVSGFHRQRRLER
jgi:hypothetical protein